MRPTCYLSVSGGNIHAVAWHRMEALQSLVTDLGAADYPLFLRVGGTPQARLQPVTARALLAEVERFSAGLQDWRIPGVRFEGPTGEELGVTYLRADGKPIAERGGVKLSVSESGIRLVVRQFPPPIGFRSSPDLPAGEYECFFELATSEVSGWLGHRTGEMGGSGAPVHLDRLPLPPVTRWDYSRVAGAPAIHRLRFVQTPACEVFRDIIHAFESACTDSLRLKHPLQIKAN